MVPKIFRLKDSIPLDVPITPPHPLQDMVLNNNLVLMFDKGDGCHIHLQPHPPRHPQHTLDHTAAHSPSEHFSLFTRKFEF